MSIEIPQRVVPGQPIVPEYDQDESSAANGVIQHARRYVAGPGTRLLSIRVSHKGGDSDGYDEVSVVSATVLGSVVVNRAADKDQDNDTEMEDASHNKKTSSTKGEQSIVVAEYEVSVVNSRQTVSTDSDGKASSCSTTSLPQVSDTVLAKVTRLSTKQANVEILCTDGKGPVLRDAGTGSAGTSSAATQRPSIPSSGSVATGSVVFTHSVGASSASLASHPADVGENFKGIIRVQDIRATEKDKVKVVDSFKPGDVVRAEIISLGDGNNYYLSTAKNHLGVVLARAHSGTGEFLYALDYETMVLAETGHVESRKCAKPF